MKVDCHSQFRKHFKKRICPYPKLVSRFNQRLHLFLVDANNSLLKDHPLRGKKAEYRSFSVAGDIRVVYKMKGNVIQLYDIGSHNQVY